MISTNSFLQKEDHLLLDLSQLLYRRSNPLIHIFYENTMFMNKQDAALFGKRKAVVAWKGKDRVTLIKDLIYARVGRGVSCGTCYERLIKVDLKCDLIMIQPLSQSFTRNIIESVIIK